MDNIGDRATADSVPRPGDIIAGKYRVERYLGQGGMGIVVAATHIALGEQVALKFLLPTIAENATAVERFLREARAAVRIKSDHIARVLDFGELPRGQPYMVMELLEGVDLNQLIKEQGPLPLADAVEYVVQACEGVAAAHALGIVHRDLKPANLFLTKRPDGAPLIKVLDFGISKYEASADLDLTDARDILGSPLYMSPERIRSPRVADPRTDIWSLGAILYKLLTGKVPFKGENESATLASIVADTPASIRELREDIPVPLDALITRCLAKDPVDRLQLVTELIAALAPYGSEPKRLALETIDRTTAGTLVDTSERTNAAAATKPSWGQVARSLGTLAAFGVLSILVSRWVGQAILRHDAGSEVGRARVVAAPVPAPAFPPASSGIESAEALVEKAAPPGDKAALPGERAAPPSEDSAPGEMAAPGEKAAVPGDKAAAPGDKAASPGDKVTVPRSDTSSRPSPPPPSLPPSKASRSAATLAPKSTPPRVSEPPSRPASKPQLPAAPLGNGANALDDRY